MATARKKCPEAIIVRPRFERYAEYSRKIMTVFESFSPVVEPLSLDEAFIDLTGAENLWGSPKQIGTKIKEAVFEATGGLHVSVGISSTKYVAKVASDQDKPNGMTIVAPNEAVDFLWPLSIDKIWGIGKKSRGKLVSLGLNTIGDVAKSDPVWLTAELGRLGEHIYRLAHANDPRPVVCEHDSKSIGAEYTLEANIRGEKEILPHLLRAADKISPQLRKKNLVAHGVRVKLKTHLFEIKTRQKRLEHPSDNSKELYQAAAELLNRFDHNQPLRLVGMAVYDLEEPTEDPQLRMFEDSTTTARKQQRKLDAQIDEIRDKYGTHALRRGSDIE